MTLRIALSALFAILTAASAVALTIRRSSSAADAWSSIAIPVLLIAAAILALNAIAAVWARRPALRAARLSASGHNSLVIETAKLGGLQERIINDGPIDALMYITATFNEGGLHLWRDYQPPRIFDQIDAKNLHSVEAEAFIQDGRRRYRLLVGSSEGTIAIPVLGRGLVRLMSPKSEEVERVASEIAALYGWRKAADSSWHRATPA